MTRFQALGILAGLIILGLLSPFPPFKVAAGVCLGMAAILALAPGSNAGRLLFSRLGPSLDAGAMTRAECWRSTGGFLVIAALALGTIVGLTALGPLLRRDPWDVPVLAALLFAFSLLVIMGIAGALYLAARAPFRPTSLGSADGGA
jgi:hypothetical protein